MPSLDVVGARWRWIESQRFKNRVRFLLKSEAVSFTQWLVLEALVELSHPDQRGVYQHQLANALGLSERVISYTLRALTARGLVGRAVGHWPDFWR